MNYNVTPTFYPGYSYPQPQTQAVGYSPAVQLPTQQMQNIPSAVVSAQPASSNICWVQGEAAAYAYPVAPGNTMILMDSDNPVVYKKSTDEHGKPLPMDVYDLIKREHTITSSAPVIDLKDYVKKSDLEAYINERLERELDRRMSQLSFKPATRKKRIDEDEEE